MDARAPAVVAVLVARQPGEWFDEVLASLRRQDYEELSVLILVDDDGPAMTGRIARHLPEAFVRRLDAPGGFGAAVNEVLDLVEGAAFFLLCHDDCAPDPDAVHLLVEESYRSNAGVVSPKMVAWEDPEVLVHVGMNADKTGAVVERVQAGEVDAGQHDGVRDVFVAPGGFTLVRADLFRELGGFDPLMTALGEDLDFSWRAQVAGSRIVVAPTARVRHLENLASGRRPPPPPPGDERQPTLQELQRRHELRAVLKCYSWVSLLLVVPQVALLSVGEALASVAVGDRARAQAILRAWTWNLRHRGDLRRARAQLREHRAFSDHEVRRLQLHGSARLSTYLSRLVYQGLDVAHARVPALDDRVAGDGADFEPELTGSVGLAFSEDAVFDELDDLGHRSGQDRFGHRRRRAVLTSRRSRLAVWIVAAVVLLVGTRNLLFHAFPLLGQLVPFLNWSTTWSHFFAGWQTPGVGTTAPASPAFGLLGLAGTVLFGSMGLLQNLAVLGCIPLGAWGVARLLRPLASPRARMVAALCYLGLPLAYNALGQARWDGLVAFAAFPWILSRLLRLSGLAPFTRLRAGVDGAWRDTVWWQLVVLGAIEAAAIAFAPAVVVVTVLAGAGVTVGSFLVGQWAGAVRSLVASVAASIVAGILLFPWLIGTALAGGDALSVLGLRSSAQVAPSWTELLRFAVGPVGLTALTWLLIAAAVLPLLVGRNERLAWAGRFWVVATASWVLALLVSRGWLGSFAPSLDVVLVPAAAAVAGSVGLGVAAFETDLTGLRFGWRQLVTMGAVVAAVVGMLPVVAEAGDGRWGLPRVGYGQPLAFMSHQTGQGAFRVLWLADPRALPGGGWSVGPGLAYATSEGGTPDLVNLWAPASPGPASSISTALQLAESGRAVDLGRLLAPASVRYLVVLGSLAPQNGGQETPVFPVPPDLLSALARQNDLRLVPSGGQGYSVFENASFVPERAERSAPLGAVSGRSASHPTAADVTGWRPVLGSTTSASGYRGPVSGGTVFASYAPAGDWHLSVDGRAVAGAPAYGWAAQYRGAPAGTAVLGFAGSPLVTVAVVLELVLWLTLAGLLVVGRRRSGPLTRRPGPGGRRGRNGNQPAAAGDDAAPPPRPASTAVGAGASSMVEPPR